MSGKCSGLNRWFVLLLVATIGYNLSPRVARAQGQLVPVTAECVLGAASLQGIPAQIILGLLKTEGGHPGSQSLNTDGSFDLGPIQVNNRVWVPLVARMHFGGNQQAAYIALRDHGCYNVYIGAWIFRQALDEAHGNYAEAVGLYNSHTPVYKERYKNRFTKNFLALFAPMMARNGG